MAYRDHPPEEKTYVTNSHDLTTSEEIVKFIKTLKSHGGGDLPEAVLDGLKVCISDISWRDNSKIPSLRYIFHLCDAPPHGKKEFGC